MRTLTLPTLAIAIGLLTLSCSDNTGPAEEPPGSWSEIGEGLGGGDLGYSVTALVVHQGRPVAAGFNSLPGGGTWPAEVRSRNGSDWELLGDPFNNRIEDLVVWNNSLVAIGHFVLSGETELSRVAFWSEGEWRPLGVGTDGILSRGVVWGDELVVGGRFTTAGGLPSRNIAAWNGTSWRAVDDGTAGQIRAFAVQDGDLIAAGSATGPDGSEAWIARLSGTEWEPIGRLRGGMGDVTWSNVRDLLVHDGSIVASGHFRFADDQQVDGIASWTGSRWTAVGSGLGTTDPSGGGNAMCLYGKDLIVGGSFATSGDLVVNGIARWKGDSLVGLKHGVVGSVTSVVTWNDALIVAGAFSQAGDTPAKNIALWRD